MTMQRSRTATTLLSAGLLTACALPVTSPTGGAFHLANVAGSATADSVIVQLKPGRGLSMALPTGQPMLLPRTTVHPLQGESLVAALLRLRRDPAVALAEPNVRLHALATVNDPQVGQLWGFAKSQVPAAWERTTGRSDVTVAVVDSGVDDTHPDLGNGQIIRGPDLVDRDRVPQDDFGHGTHVAGTIVATANNGIGVAGMAYGCKVLAVRVLGTDGSGDLANVADGILQAQRLGAKVINLSLGGTESESILEQAVTTVTKAGCLVVAAAGNSDTTQPSYPAAYAPVLSVGASDQRDQRASFSNYGANTAIAAPGVGILSTSAGTYKSMNGTSMASPHVAAAAALLFSLHPEATPDQVKQALVNGGDAVSGFGGTIKRLNVTKAMTALDTALGTIPSPQPSPSTGAPSPQPLPSSEAPSPSPAPSADPTPVPMPSAQPVIGLPQPFTRQWVSAVGRASITLNWTTVGPSFGYAEWAGSERSGRTGWTSGAPWHQVNVNGLRPGSTYRCRAVAYTGNGAAIAAPWLTVTTRN